MNDMFFEYNNTIKIVVNERPLRKESVHLMFISLYLLNRNIQLIDMKCYALFE